QVDGVRDRQPAHDLGQLVSIQPGSFGQLADSQVQLLHPVPQSDHTDLPVDGWVSSFQVFVSGKVSSACQLLPPCLRNSLRSVKGQIWVYCHRQAGGGGSTTPSTAVTAFRSWDCRRSFSPTYLTT